MGGTGVVLDMPIASIREAEILADTDEDTKPQLNNVSVSEGVYNRCT